MKEILINVSKETRMVDLSKNFIGVDGENLQNKLVFTFIDEFINGQARLEYEIKGNKNYVVLDKENNTYTTPVKNVITKEGQIDMQLVITEGTDDEEIPVFKSNKFYLFCNSSINAVDEAPDGYELWIEQANAKLNEFDKVIDVIKTDGTGNKYLSDDGTYKFVQGGTGEGGAKEIHIGENEPTNDEVFWIDTSGEASGGTGGGSGAGITGLTLNDTMLTIQTTNGDVSLDLSPIFDTRNFVYYEDDSEQIDIEQNGTVLYIRSNVTVTQNNKEVTIGG